MISRLSDARYWLAVARDEVSGITNGSVSASIVRVRVRHPRAVPGDGCE
jgi:hypothetical protein